MAKTTEAELGLAVMRVLLSEPRHEATVRTLIREVPKYVELTAEDREMSNKRPNEEMWEQRVRNLKSHDNTPVNVIGEGFVARVSRSIYQLTDAGRSQLRYIGDAQSPFRKSVWGIPCRFGL